MKTYKNMHVLLLKGGDGSEREVSLNTATECAKAIKQIGCKITEVDIAESNISCLSKINADICFIAFAHSIAVFIETSLSEPSPPFNNKMCKFS